MITLSWILPLGCILGCSLSAPPNFPPLSDSEIHYINRAQSTWKAERHFHPHHVNFAKRLLGADLKVNGKAKDYFPTKGITVTLKDIPDSFDPRDKWPDCDTMKEIRDQGDCGSCWAFSSVETMSDRICIQSKKNIRLSAEDMVACDTMVDNGCNGGAVFYAYMYYMDYGVVTGGPYGSKQGCLPYTIAPTGVNTSDDFTVQPTPNCTAKCIPEYGSTYKKDKHFGNNLYNVPQSVEDIQKELYTNGPATASFTVYSDFMSYKSGVYKHTTGKELGGHGVKIMGWGVENGTDYWLVANSWNVTWGEKGFFKIARGTNECGIEANILAGEPKLKLP